MYRPNYVVTFQCSRGFGMTVGSRETSKARAMRYAAICFRAAKPAWSRLESVTVETCADHDAAMIAREYQEANPPRVDYHAPRYI